MKLSEYIDWPVALVIVIMLAIVAATMVVENRRMKSCDARGGIYVHRDSLCLKRDTVVLP